MNTYSVPGATRAHFNSHVQESTALIDWLRETRRLCNVYNEAMTARAMTRDSILKIGATSKIHRGQEPLPDTFG